MIIADFILNNYSIDVISYAIFSSTFDVCVGKVN